MQWQSRKRLKHRTTIVKVRNLRQMHFCCFCSSAFPWEALISGWCLVSMHHEVNRIGSRGWRSEAERESELRDRQEAPDNCSISQQQTANMTKTGCMTFQAPEGKKQFRQGGMRTCHSAPSRHKIRRREKEQCSQRTTEDSITHKISSTRPQEYEGCSVNTYRRQHPSHRVSCSALLQQQTSRVQEQS